MAGPTLHDDVWTRRGISLLWDADSLAHVCTPQQVVSLRRFLELHTLGWPAEQFSLVNDRVLVVAGLESAIDALTPDQACHWLEQVVYKAIVSYQREVADGGGQAALVFWITENRRLTYQTSDDIYYWHCGTEYKGQQIPVSRSLFQGAHHDLQRLHVVDGKKTEHWIGLFHPRIS
jgi:hypothetical protein